MSETIKIDDKEYNIDDLNETAKYSLRRLKEYELKTNSLKIELKEIEIITNAYINTLKKEVEDAKPILQQDSQTEGDPEKKN